MRYINCSENDIKTASENDNWVIYKKIRPELKRCVNNVCDSRYFLYNTNLNIIRCAKCQHMQYYTTEGFNPNRILYALNYKIGMVVGLKEAFIQLEDGSIHYKCGNEKENEKWELSDNMPLQSARLFGKITKIEVCKVLEKYYWKLCFTRSTKEFFLKYNKERYKEKP